jgi:hypothetical protein
MNESHPKNGSTNGYRKMSNCVKVQKDFKKKLRDMLNPHFRPHY